MASELYADDPAIRLLAASHLGRRARKALAKEASGWPADSPGAINAWLLLVTTKPPTWRDPLLIWRDVPPTLGTPNEGFFYPDPLGFWAEVRHWATTITGLPMPDALSVTALLHATDHVAQARSLMRPHVTLFLDEAAWRAAAIDVATTPHRIRDPYRGSTYYEGHWGTTPEGTVIGKAPQHPAAHKLYRRSDMDAFLASATS